jgi:hypothetical protein
MSRLPSSGLASAIVAASVALAPAALGWSVRVTCTDGASIATVRSGGHRAEFAGVCDLDGRVDGVCTFYADRVVLRCGVAGGAGCQDVFDDSDPAPCPFSTSPIAVPLRTRRRVARGISVYRPPNPKYPPERLVLRCIRGVAETSSTTTTLPGIPDMRGDWVFDVRTLTSDCPGAVSALVGTPMLVDQSGTILHACRMSYLAYQGTAREGGFAFDPRGSFGGSLYDLVSSIGGTVASDGTIDVTEELDGHVSRMPESSCSVLWRGTMRARTGADCRDHSDCIHLEGPCSRCQDGICRVPPPFCRAGPAKPTRLGIR